MNLTHDVAYDQIVNVASARKAGAIRVIPGDPENSYLIHKVEGSPDIVGAPNAVQRRTIPDRRADPDSEALDRHRRAPQLVDRSLRETLIDLRFRPPSRTCAGGRAGFAGSRGAGSRRSGRSSRSSRSEEDDDEALKPAEPDFTLISLPTALRVPKYKSAFRVTHRFTRPIASGDFGDFVANFFGIDSGAMIGLEYRFGIVPNGQIGVHRTSDRTIEFFGEYGLFRQGQRLPLEIAVITSIEGTDNFKDSKSPAVGAVVSRRVGSHAAFYVEPIWVNNTNPLPKEVVDHNDTFMIGLGARIRIRPTVYVVAEASPRVAGFKPGVTQGGFAIEKHAGGHQFQLNFSDSFGTTMGQIARGGARGQDWYMGFNISRKFF